MCPRNCKFIKGLEQKFTLVFLFAQVINIGYSSPTPEDWVSGSPFSQFTADDTRVDTFISAYLNVTFLTEDGWKWDKTDVGRYGGGYIGPAFGELVHVTSLIKPDDHWGCHLPFGSSRSDQKLPPPGTPWIALIKRGRCNFEDKVENAFTSNAAGVLVYNDRDSAFLDKMKLSSDSRRNISAVFIYKWKGDELANKLENDSKVFIHITIAGHTSSRTANINRTSVLFVSITFIVLMIISLTWLVFYYVQRFRYIRTKDKLSRLGNAAKKALSKIPTKNLKSEDKEIQGDCECCAICIEPYKLSETLRILPCRHEFHKNCIDPWLLEHRTCPMCKMDILKHYGFVFTGSQESILQLDGDMGQESLGSQNSSPRHLGGLSPLPEIRVMVSDRQMPRFFDNSVDDDSSRASTPDEMTPSLPQRGSFPVRQELCVSCIAAKAAAVINQINHDKQIVINEEASTSTASDIQQVLSINMDSDKTCHNSTMKRCT
nr:protein goliath isoform X2 [Leptinotarsa decemlineata]